MTSTKPCILTLNGGSSSIRFAAFEASGNMKLMLDGKVERIGLPGTALSFRLDGVEQPALAIGGSSHETASNYLVDWLEAQPFFASTLAIGHRVVHGMKHSEPAKVSPELIEQLRGFLPYDPEHLPREIGLIETIGRRFPKMPQVACFDTAFHRTMPKVARTLAIPRKYQEKGVERYGFHGLSYAYLMEELRRLDPSRAQGKVILAHLGNGASMAAVLGGESRDTSMSFTPTSGMMMGSRSGDIDAGLPYFLAKTEHMTPKQFQAMVNEESGLLGVSGTSSDMRDLLEREASDERAAEAVTLFCYQAKKLIGSFSAVLGGLGTLVFAGGVGENSPAIRARICEGLELLGVEIDASMNEAGAPVISSASSSVTVRVIRTNEELMIARSVLRTLADIFGD